MKSFSKVSIGVCILFLLYQYYCWYNIWQTPRTVLFYYEQTVSVIGTVIRTDDRYTGTLVTIIPKTIESQAVDHPRFEKINITVPQMTSPKIGDIVNVHGEITQPESFVTNTGSVFDYREYLATEHIHALMRNSTVTYVSRDKNIYYTVFRTLSEMQHSIRNHIEQLFPAPIAALYAGIMIGDKSLFPSELLQVFRDTGLIHIMVLSGSNIALVAGWVFIFSRRFGYHMRYVIAGIVMIMFVAMTGFAPPATRAIIMMLSGYAARILVRPQSSVRIFILTLFVMFLFNPLIIYNVSFHLSVLATIAIIFVSPIIEQWATMISERYELRTIFAQTLASQIMVVPYTMMIMGMISWVALPLNMIVLPIVGIMTIGGFVLVVGSYISMVFSTIISLPFIWLGDFVVLLSQYVARFSGAFGYVHTVSWVWIIGYYTAVFVWIRKLFDK